MIQQNQISDTILSINSDDTIQNVPNDTYLKSDSIRVISDSTNSVSQDVFASPVCNSEQKENPDTIVVSSKYDYERSSWFIAVLIIILILVSKIKLSFPKLLSFVFQAFVRNSSVLKLQESRNSSNSIGYFFMNSLALLTTSVFILEYCSYNSIIKNSSFLSLLYIMIGVLLFFLFKIIIVKILGFLFRSYTESSEYVFNLLVVWKSVGMMLIPVVVSVPFINYSAINIFNIIGVITIVFAYVLIILRGLRILFLKHVSLLYMILYLCALEIVPILIIYKLLLA